MDNMIFAVVNGLKRPMHYSIDVMFAVNDKYGSVQNALDALAADTREGFAVLRTLTVAMANDAELCRRAEGYDHSPMLEEKDVSLRMKPIEYAALKQAVCSAVALGYKQEKSSEEEETDLGLLELKKKEEAGS